MFLIDLAHQAGWGIELCFLRLLSFGIGSRDSGYSIMVTLGTLSQALRNGVGKDSGFQFVVMVKGFTLCIKLWYAEPTRTDQFAGCRCTLACVSSR